MRSYYQQDNFQLATDKITEETHPVFGDMTIFHGVVIASEIVQPYDDGLAFKPRDELEKYAPYVDGRWIIAGAHPADGIISDTGQIAGRTMGPRYVKDLIDPKTKRPNRAGVRADVQIFNDKVTKTLLNDMKTGKKPDVSIGFFYSKDETPGVVEADSCKGEKYDYVQRNMFHDHTAVGIDAGRCPMPYCGLGADEVKQSLTGDPFGGFSGFNDCVSKIMEKNPKLSKESAIKICGSLKEKQDNNISADKRQNIKALVNAVIDACEEADGSAESRTNAVNLREAVLQSLTPQIDAKINEMLIDKEIKEILKNI